MIETEKVKERWETISCRRDGGSTREENVTEVRGVDAQSEKEAGGGEPKEEEEKENQCVLGLETIAWEKVKACCSVGLREKGRWVG